MTVDQHAILMRIKRKVQILRMDFLANNNTKHHDAAEILSLIDLMEKNQ